MEMKDIILSTLQEFEENGVTDNDSQSVNKRVVEAPQKAHQTGIEELKSIMSSVHNISDSSYDEDKPKNEEHSALQPPAIPVEKVVPVPSEPIAADVVEKRQDMVLSTHIESELRFLNSLRERVLVIFEGLQSPNNRNLDAKVDLIINFLEYQLAIVDERLENLKRSS
jgi:hypothetical protein